MKQNLKLNLVPLLSLLSLALRRITRGGGVYQYDNINLTSAETCNTDQRAKIYDSLQLGQGGSRVSYATRCPDPTWIDLWYREGIAIESFLGISVCCNTGSDAIQMTRMGMSNSDFDVLAWAKAMDSDEISYVCHGAASKEVNSKTKRPGEMHCIEPMPETFLALSNASTELDTESKNFIVSHTAISSTNGEIKFPIGNAAGVERFGMDACDEGRNCKSVPMYTLETYVDKFVRGTGPVNILQIDVEGFDFDVLFGASSVLDRTQYLEFEYHRAGHWGSLHLQDAVRLLLDRKGFTCYWMGKGKLWRSTECYVRAYDIWYDWSNVACVHRRGGVALAKIMEYVFDCTIFSRLIQNFVGPIAG